MAAWRKERGYHALSGEERERQKRDMEEICFRKGKRVTLMFFSFLFSLVLFVCFYPVFAWLVRNPTKSSPA